MNLPTVQANVTFLTTEDGGRQTTPNLCHEYRPHIVVQSPEIRQAQVDENGVGCEAYLGVCFVESDHDCQLGQPVRTVMELMYYLRVDYSEVQPGCTFTIREGGKVVGYGSVLSRTNPDGLHSVE